MNKKTFIISGIAIVGIAIILVVLLNNRDNSNEKILDKNEIDISQINDWAGLTDLYQEKAFQSLSDDQKCDIIDEVILKVKEKYGFESYEYNIKQSPLVISLHFSDGHIEAVQLGDFDPGMN
jgi:hypothetical protein